MQSAPQITPPYGFQEVIPLNKTHRVLLPKGTLLPMPFRAMNPMPVTFTEFPLASRDYPLVFASSDQGKSYSPVAVIGLSNGENLFVKDGRWDPLVYLPAYVRRYPFCMSRVTMDGKEQDQRLICVEQAFVSDDGEMLSDIGEQVGPFFSHLCGYFDLRIQMADPLLGFGSHPLTVVPHVIGQSRRSGPIVLHNLL
jgi:hypothetical protein